MSDFFTLFMEKGSNYFVDFPILRKRNRYFLTENTCNFFHITLYRH